MSLEGKHVVITGGGGNLGRELGAASLLRGAKVSLIDLSFNTASAYFADMATYRADLTDAADTGRCFRKLGDVEVLFNVAGGFAAGERAYEISDGTWDRMLGLNVRTLLNCTASVVPSMVRRGAGKIVNVGSMSARTGVAGMGAYCVAKSAVLRLTESLSQEIKRHGVNVNCVLPGIIDTPENRAAMPDSDHTQWVAPSDLAAVMCFLASDDARAIHGQALVVANLA